MVRFLLRALGFCLVAAAFAALVVDGTRSIAGGRLLQYGIGDTAAWLGGAPLPVRAVAGAALAVPGWLASGALGLALLHAGRPQAARPGFSSPAT